MTKLFRMDMVEDNPNQISDLAIIPIEVVLGATVLNLNESIIILN